MKTKDVNEDSMKELLKDRDHDNDMDLAMWSLCKACIARNGIYTHFRIYKAAEQTDSLPTKMVLRVLNEQNYPQDYVQSLDSFHNDEPGLLIKDNEFLKEFRYVEFKIWTGSTIKSAEKLNTLRSKLRRLARIFIHFKIFTLEKGIEVNSCADIT